MILIREEMIMKEKFTASWLPFQFLLFLLGIRMVSFYGL